MPKTSQRMEEEESIYRPEPGQAVGYAPAQPPSVVGLNVWYQESQTGFGIIMQLPREIKIRIRPNGKVELETEGFVGSSCAEVSEFFEKLLIGDKDNEGDVHREFKPEYYLAETNLEQENEEYV